MSVPGYLLLVSVAALFSAAAYRLALRKGRDAKRWVVATLLFGPLTLVPLLILAKRRS